MAGPTVSEVRTRALSSEEKSRSSSKRFSSGSGGSLTENSLAEAVGAWTSVITASLAGKPFSSRKRRRVSTFTSGPTLRVRAVPPVKSME